MADKKKSLEAEAQAIIDKGQPTSWSGVSEDRNVIGVFISDEGINSLRRIIRTLASA